MSLDILVIGGGTGGHLFPAIATIEKATEKGLKAALITDERCEKYIKNIDHIEYFLLTLGNRNSLLSKMLQIFLTIIAIFKSIFLLFRLRPKIVIGFGGYVSYPTLFVSNLLGIPIMLHEQNCFLGKVNKFFATRSSMLFLGFEDTLNLPKDIDMRKVIFTGNPIRKDIASIKKTVKKNKDRLTILVTGGSQGASILSKIIPESIVIMKQDFQNIDFKIVQQARSEDIENVKNTYLNHNIEANISDFFYNMPELIKEADIFIGRAGASTIAEIIDAEIPCILIPYPYASEKHQHVNANFIEKKGGGIMIDQKDLTEAKIVSVIGGMLKSTSKLKSMKSSLKKMKRNSSDIIVDTAEKIIRDSSKKN